MTCEDEELEWKPDGDTLILVQTVLALQLHEIDIDDRAAVEHFLGGNRSPEFIDAVIVQAKSDRAERWFGADPLDAEPQRKQ
jgi:hypothetical protein